ncbi:anhydro-N-acetylmuramic acid kinase [Pasteurella multocida]|nr:anhydro-N-acetylmuramic acid kinase [Pasteurella multocida]
MYYIGVMSGTSLDGVDLALMDFSCAQPQLIHADFYPMPPAIRQQISTLCNSGTTTLQALGELDHQLGLLYTECIQQFLQKYQLSPEQITAIGCHGQTVWHSPNSHYPFTMQIGDANLIAAKTGITTVADFRRKDMAFGGQGAPLVPAFHQALFRKPTVPTAEARVLLTKSQLSDLSDVVKKIADAANEGLISPNDMFAQLRSVAAAMGQDPSKIKAESATKIADLGLLGEYLDNIPYKSQVTSIDEDTWKGMSVQEQEKFIRELHSKLRHYRVFNEDQSRWISLSEGSDPRDFVYPVPLEALP